jgi:SAM-dependent methyltransferase
MHQDAIVAEFTRQAEGFNVSEVARASATLDDLVALAAPRAGERWLEAACGPGLIARRLAPAVGSVLGVDATPAMIEVARREAAGLENAEFAVGDATALELPDGSFDGAIARFTIHHVPVPARLVDELARVVRPGGHVVLADHVVDDDARAAGWAQEIERLRDPSHWACLTVAGLRALGEGAGLALEEERIFAVELDYDDWLVRGSGGAAAAPLIDRALRGRPPAASSFGVGERDGRRVLMLRMWTARWRR